MKKILLLLCFATQVNAAQKLNSFQCEVIGYSADFMMSLLQHGHDDTTEVLESRREYAPYFADYYKEMDKDARRVKRVDLSDIDETVRNFSYKWQDICKKRNGIYTKLLEIKK